MLGIAASLHSQVSIAMQSTIFRAAAIARSLNNSLRTFVLAAAGLIAGMSHPTAYAGSIVVGRAGPTNGCTVPSIQAAINRANGFGGHNVILVTDDVADGVHHENLNLSNLRPGLKLEIIGGFNNCRDLAPTTSGKASIYGGGTNAPVINIAGQIDLVMRGLWMEGGVRGIQWNGRGRVELTNSTINNNRGNGIDVRGSGGEPGLHLLGNVVVSNHSDENIGIYAARAAVTIRGDGNAIRRNFHGIEIRDGAHVDIGATGPVLTNNRSDGFHSIALGDTAPPSYIYSVNADNPLVIANNGSTAIHSNVFVGADDKQKLCLRNIAIRSNDLGIFAYGPRTHVEMNGTTCVFPADADVACNHVNYASCNTFYDNDNAQYSLISSWAGATVDINRVLLYRNRAHTILATNAHGESRPATLTMTQSIVVENNVKIALFRALDATVLDIWDSTVAANVGEFGASLIGTDPTLLQLTNTIVDQPQPLLAHTGEPANVRLNRLLAPNQHGADLVSRTMLIGRPTFTNDIGRLSASSLGVDYAPAGGGVDRDGNPRDIDILGMPNGFGPRDLGAFEVQQSYTDRIMADGFE